MKCKISQLETWTEFKYRNKIYRTTLTGWYGKSVKNSNAQYIGPMDEESPFVRVEPFLGKQF